MRKYLILAQSEITANALNSWLEIMGEAPLPPEAPGRIVWRENALSGDSDISAYESLMRKIEQALMSDDGRVPLNEAVVLVDSVNPEMLSVVQEKCTWDNLLALLILSFPELLWAFGSVNGVKTFPKGHALETLWTNCYRNPLLDPTGLRTWVRSKTNTALEKLKDDLELPQRNALAVAIDEEGHYAYLNAYTAYRFGCQADIVSTWTLMNELFGRSHVSDGPDQENIERKAGSHGYWLLLEDMSLNFPDRPHDVHLLRLQQYEDGDRHQGRAYWCPKLDSTKLDSSRRAIETSTHRILVTTGQARDDSSLSDNRRYLDGKATGTGDCVFKPSKGIFGLWREAKLLKRTFPYGRMRNVVKFDWPRKPPPVPKPFRTFSTWHSPPENNRGHGAPGKLMLVATGLIRRSRELIGKADSVESAIQGAVLATDALELTGGRTPTSAVDALTLKHHFEVLAECQFSGVAHQINTKWRWNDIKAETESISQWFQPKQIRNAKLNARMHILNRLVRVFREHNKFDEEQQCMIKARNVHYSLWLKRRSYRFLFILPVRYFELLMRSVSWFLFCLLIWVLLFAMVFTRTGNYQTYWHGLFDAVSSILAISAPASHHASPDFEVFSLYALAVCGAILTGVAHLGVFVSHLYTIVSRK